MGASSAAREAVFASRNPGKSRELEALLPGWRIEPLAADTYPPETGETYYENSRAKALFGRSLEKRPLWVLGEDSGIEVAALEWGPGASRRASVPTTRSGACWRRSRVGVPGRRNLSWSGPNRSSVSLWVSGGGTPGYPLAVAAHSVPPQAPGNRDHRHNLPGGQLRSPGSWIRAIALIGNPPILLGMTASRGSVAWRFTDVLNVRLVSEPSGADAHVLRAGR